MIEPILCATIKTIASVVSFFKAFLRIASVLKSRAEKLSSNIYISGFLTKALAIDNLCFCPPDTLDPPSLIGSSKPFSLLVIKS